MAKSKGRITASRAFLEELARIFDPFSNFGAGPYSGPRKKTDMEMLRSDWITIGRDMQTVLDGAGKQEPENTGR